PFPKETAVFALRHRLPTMTLMGSLDPVGQLIAYGANFGEQVRHVASHVDRILKGAKPARPPRRAADKVRTGDQSQDRQGARSDDPADPATAGGSRDRSMREQDRQQMQRSSPEGAGAW